MTTYRVCKRFDLRREVTGKSADAMRLFGLTAEQMAEKAVTHEMEIDIEAGDVVYITGPSGCGKSVLLGELEKKIPQSERANLSCIELSDDKTLLDCIDGDLLHSLRVLSTAGLNDCLCILNSPAKLSDGQKYRFRLASAIASGRRFIFADEFCTGLDRITAAVIAYNVRRYANRNKVAFILASSHDDILADLSADVLVLKELSGPAKVIYKNKRGVNGEKL